MAGSMSTIAPHQIGPLADVDVHVALGYYPEDAAIARWDTARWDTAAAVWAGPPTLDDVSCNVVSVTTTEGRDLPLERFRPGTCTVVLDDPDGRYSPWRTAPEPDAFNTVRTGIDLVVWVEIDDVRIPRFAGIVDSITDTFPGTVRHEVEFEAFDYLSLLAAFDGVEHADAGSGETSGPRLARICDAAGYIGERAFDVGTVPLQATTLAKNALDEAGMVCDTELGALWCDRDGVLQHRDRNGLVNDDRYTEVQAIFGEVEPEICYSEIVLASDLDKIKNIVSISRAGGVATTRVDTASVSLYRSRTYRRFDLIHLDDAESAVIAQRHLDFYAYAANRIEALTVDLATIPAARALVLMLDTLWRIQVRRRAQGFQVVADLQIQGIRESITATDWTITFTTFSAVAVFNVGRWDSDEWNTGLWGY